jgi:putative methylase
MEKIQFQKADLINLIQSLEPFRDPKVELEQYTIDAVCAVDIIYFAGVEFNDISGNIIFDLGVGTGRLAIASTFLLPKRVIGIDIDEEALAVLIENKKELPLVREIHPLCCDVDKIPLKIDSRFLGKSQITTIMNPPFGVQKKYADRKFLKAAMEISDVIYSIHLASEQVHRFIRNFIGKSGWTIDYLLPYNMILEGTFPFHKKARKQIDVNVYKFVKRLKR